MLVKYKKNEEVLREKDSKVLESYPLNEEINNFIEENNLSEKLSILEEDSNEKIEIIILSIKSLNKIKIKIKQIIIEKAKELSENQVSNKEEDNLLNICKELLNLRGLCLEKIERHSDKNYVLVQLG